MEFFDIVDENDKVIGKEERNKVHDKHLLHRSTHIIIVNSKNQVLCQLRKSTKKQYPLYWSSSTAGHVSSGETPQINAKRELKEELGISVELEYLGKFIVDDKVEHEMVHIFFGKSDGPFTPEYREIEEVKFIEIKELYDKMNNMKLTPHFREAIERVYQKHYNK